MCRTRLQTRHPAPRATTLKRRRWRSPLHSAQRRRATELCPHRLASRSCTLLPLGYVGRKNKGHTDDAHSTRPVTLAQIMSYAQTAVARWSCISSPLRCGVFEHSTMHRTRIVKKKKDKLKVKKQEYGGPADNSIHAREEGPTVQLCGDCNVAKKCINGHYALGQKYRGEIGHIPKSYTRGGRERLHFPPRRSTTT